MKNNLLKFRIKANLTQEELSRITDISLSQIRNIEKCRSIPNVLTAIRIKKALHIEHIEDLFNEDN